MKKTAFFMATLVAASMLGAAPVYAKDEAKIKRLQAEQRMAEASAQAALETQQAYEDAWRKTKSAAKGAACIAGSLYAGPAVAVGCYGHNTFRNK